MIYRASVEYIHVILSLKASRHGLASVYMS